ncbi:MAG: hypothetical protein F6K24_03965 [Okeania sp. SIO2D1]|nr:hypothetical protein [Okeania sp. SIO2D1]
MMTKKHHKIPELTHQISTLSELFLNFVILSTIVKSAAIYDLTAKQSCKYLFCRYFCSDRYEFFLAQQTNFLHPP